MRRMQHFNQLTPAEAERLAIVAEECAEVIQAVTKTLRHGYESTNPLKADGETNRKMLQREIADLQHALLRLVNSGDIDWDDVEQRKNRKPELIASYLHHQSGDWG